MRLTVQFLGGFQHLVPTEELEIRVGRGADLRQLIQELGQRLGPALLEYLLNPDGERRSGLAILINGAEAALGRDLASRLEDGDTITFLPMIGGG